MFNPVSAAFGTVGKIADLADKWIVDKDAKIQIEAQLEQLKQQVYITELGVSTIPWVDALHKMGRQIISLVTLVGGIGLVYFKPDVDPMVLAMIAGPSGIYNFAKGKGK